MKYVIALNSGSKAGNRSTNDIISTDPKPLCYTRNMIHDLYATYHDPNEIS